MSDKFIGAVFLSVSASIWGGMFVVVKMVVEEIPPVFLVWLRYLVAIIFLFGASLIQHTRWHFYKKDIGIIILIGLIGNTVSIVAQETGTWLSSAQMGAVVTSATPVFMLMFAWLMLGENIDKFKIISIIMAAVGVFLTVGQHIPDGTRLLGAGLLIVAALAWALMTVLIKKVSANYSSLQIVIMGTAAAIIFLTPYVVANGYVLAQINFSAPKIWGGLLYLGCISTAIAFVLWSKGVQLMNASSSGLFFLLQPIVGTLLGWLLLGEHIFVSFLFGASLIICSVYLSVKFTK